MTIIQSTTTKTKTTRTVTVFLTDQSLLKGIEKELNLQEGETIVSMQFVIPRGGDYSGMNVDTNALELVVVTEKIENKSS